MTPLFLSESVIVVLLGVIVVLLAWIRLREKHWLHMIDAINQSWNQSREVPPTGYPHTRLHRDSRALPGSTLALGRRSGRQEGVA